MSAEEISLQVVDALNAQRVAYMLVGSLSTNFHSVVRATKDADIVIQSGLEDAAHLIAQACPGLRLDRQYGFENVTATKKIMLRAESEDFVVELFALSDDAHDQCRFARRQCVDWMGRATWIASPEDALITKLRWAQSVGREKDVADARNLIAVQGDSIDWSYVEFWCGQHGSRSLLERIRRTLVRSRFSTVVLAPPARNPRDPDPLARWVDRVVGCVRQSIKGEILARGWPDLKLWLRSSPLSPLSTSSVEQTARTARKLPDSVLSELISTDLTTLYVVESTDALAAFIWTSFEHDCFPLLLCPADTSDADLKALVMMVERNSSRAYSTLDVDIEWFVAANEEVCDDDTLCVASRDRSLVDRIASEFKGSPS